jgi:hypothetical protein
LSSDTLLQIIKFSKQIVFIFVFLFTNQSLVPRRDLSLTVLKHKVPQPLSFSLEEEGEGEGEGEDKVNYPSGFAVF